MFFGLLLSVHGALGEEAFDSNEDPANRATEQGKEGLGRVVEQSTSAGTTTLVVAPQLPPPLNVTQLQQQLAALQAQITALQQQVVDLTGRLNAAEGDLSETHDDLSTVSELFFRIIQGVLSLNDPPVTAAIVGFSADLNAFTRINFTENGIPIVALVNDAGVIRFVTEVQKNGGVINSQTLLNPITQGNVQAKFS